MRKSFTILVGVACAIALVGIVSANVIPDQTWTVLTRLETEYLNIVSRLTPMPTSIERNVQEEDIREAVFRDLIDWKKVKRPVFLRLESKDPSDAFMARFTNSAVPVYKASAACFDQRTLRGPIDQSTGETGLILSVGSIRWIAGDRVEAKAVLSCGYLCGQGGVYQLIKRRGRWTADTYTNKFFN
jgi:hypothetical protein